MRAVTGVLTIPAGEALLACEYDHPSWGVHGLHAPYPLRRDVYAALGRVVAVCYARSHAAVHLAQVEAALAEVIATLHATRQAWDPQRWPVYVHSEGRG